MNRALWIVQGLLTALVAFGRQPVLPAIRQRAHEVQLASWRQNTVDSMHGAEYSPRAARSLSGIALPSSFSLRNVLTARHRAPL